MHDCMELLSYANLCCLCLSIRTTPSRRALMNRGESGNLLTGNLLVAGHAVGDAPFRLHDRYSHRRASANRAEHNICFLSRLVPSHNRPSQVGLHAPPPLHTLCIPLSRQTETSSYPLHSCVPAHASLNRSRCQSRQIQNSNPHFLPLRFFLLTCLMHLQVHCTLYAAGMSSARHRVCTTAWMPPAYRRMPLPPR